LLTFPHQQTITPESLRALLVIEHTLRDLEDVLASC
jgi:hypothetical protein